MTGKYVRPAGAYAGMNGLANASKYQDDAAAVPKRAISSSKMDGDFNFIVEALNKIDEASGTKASIAERLDASLNADGTLKGSVVATVDDWVAHTGCGALARVDDSSISMDGGDFRALYVAGRRIRIMIAGSFYYADVAEASYAAGVTTLAVSGLVDASGVAAVIANTPSAVAYGFVCPGVTGTLVTRFAGGVELPAGSADYRLRGDAGDLLVERNGVEVARFDAGGLVGQEVNDIGVDQLAAATVARLLPSGVVMPFAGASIPSGWLPCDGSVVSRSVYADLFAVIGTVYGNGDGSTTFQVPDLRGRAVFGKDSMGGTAAGRLTSAGSSVDGAVLGASGGSQLMQQHTHTVSDPGHRHVQGFAFPLNGTPQPRWGVSNTGINSGNYDTGGGVNDTYGANTSTVTTGISINNSGSGSSQNMPPALVLNYIIKV